MKFESLSICEPLLRAIQAAGYENATDIQKQAIGPVLEGRDLVGCAQTGTGKTAAFALPTLQRLMTAKEEPTGADRRAQRSGRRRIRGLILAPTRELAAQIGGSLATYGRFTDLRHNVIYGGVGQGPQVRALQNGVDILVATPGRLLDLIGQGFVNLSAVEILILDEADQMLDMGFINDLRKIVRQVPAERQTLMFSATMPPEIRKLAAEWLHKPFEVQAAPIASTPKLVSQAVYFVEKNQKAATLTRFLQGTNAAKTLVFSRTKHGADKIVRSLERDGIRAIAIHGNKSQAKRQAVIRQFSSARPPVLVATDIASRGLDFSDITHVINYDLPETPETYVHRIGRTARAGASGQAVSFCDRDERQRLRRIEKLTGQAVKVERMPGTTEPAAADSSPETAYKPPAEQGRARDAKAKIVYNGGGGDGRRDGVRRNKYGAAKKGARRKSRPATGGVAKSSAAKTGVESQGREISKMSRRQKKAARIATAS